VLARWAVALQNDVRARMAWCLEQDSFGPLVNHPPLPLLGGPDRIQIRFGGVVPLDAGGSTDPDGDELSFEWIPYPEPGGNGAALTVEGKGPRVSVRAPAVKSPEILHLVLAVTDSGRPPLTRYRRLL
ncbi:MAG: hypothetical protein HY293_08655, partial [Planctomycetes bacterium]|nr:hypothetical protein [Planctomycetota bacterium]